MKKISVIVPAHNAEKYLRECLNSICNQTYQNLEIIIVDDGSNDSTASIVKKYADQDKRITPYYNENHGVSYSRNFALNRCTGDYVAFVDSDDIIAPDFIGQMVHDLEKVDADIATVGVVKNRIFQAELFTGGEMKKYERPDILRLAFGVHEGYLCNKLFKLNIIKENELQLQQDIAVCEDLLFNVEYLLNCKKAVYNNGKKYFYRQDKNSVSNRLDNSKWFDAIKAYHRILKVIKEYPDVQLIAENQYAMFLGAARYRVRFVEDPDGVLKSTIEREWRKMHICWNNFNIKQRLKLYIISLVPGLVVHYQRRKL